MHVNCPNCGAQTDVDDGESTVLCAGCRQQFELTESHSLDFFSQASGSDTLPFVDAGDVALTKLAGYRLIRLLGQGGMGRVFEAEQVTTGKRVAIKLIAPTIAFSTNAIDRFRQEARLASGISHSRCVFVLGAGDAAGQPFIVMELMTGKTLRDLVEEQGPWLKTKLL